MYLWCELCQQHLVLLVVTGSDHTQSALLHHLTPTVLIGDPGGQPHAAGLRAGAPLCGLLNAVEAGVVIVKSHRFLLTIGWRQRWTEELVEKKTTRRLLIRALVYKKGLKAYSEKTCLRNYPWFRQQSDVSHHCFTFQTEQTTLSLSSMFPLPFSTLPLTFPSFASCSLSPIRSEKCT